MLFSVGLFLKIGNYHHWYATQNIDCNYYQRSDAIINSLVTLE